MVFRDSYDGIIARNEHYGRNVDDTLDIYFIGLLVIAAAMILPNLSFYIKPLVDLF